MSTLTQCVDRPEGFSIVDLPASLLKLSEELIAERLRTVVAGGGASDASLDALLAEVVAGPGFETVKGKLFRMFDKTASGRWLQHDFCRQLFAEDPSLFVSDEEDLGYPNVYWRLVRAGSASDVGPVHADHWFWDLGHGRIPDGFRRVKTWLPLRQDAAYPGLCIGPGTQAMHFDYEKVVKDGKAKPVFDRKGVDHLMKPAPVSVGQAVVFHDRLLHGGEVSPRSLRLSMELTWVMRDTASAT